MTQPKKFKDESQDARRHDQHDVTHPYEKSEKKEHKPHHNDKDNKRK